MSGPFSVFHVDGERGLRGGERQLLYLAGALRARGHRSVVACRRSSPLEGEASRLGLETLRLPFLTEWDPVSAVMLKRAATGRNRVLIHAHTGHGAGVAALCRALGGPPAVMHRRVDFPLGCGLSRRLKYGRAGRVVAVSAAIKGVVVGPGLEADRVAVIPDAVPVGPEEAAWAGVAGDRFAPPSPYEKARLRGALAEEFGIPADAAWVGNLAALVPHKDHDNLLAAAMIVLWKRPGTVFLIAGQGPEGPRLFESVRRLGLVGKVFFVGQRDEPLDLLKALDVFVLSSWGEGMGSVLLEAAACGIPIAATRAGGIPEVVADGETGLLAPVRDADALAAAVLRLLGEPELARRVAAAARSGLSRFGLKRLVEATERVYEGAWGA